MVAWNLSMVPMAPHPIPHQFSEPYEKLCVDSYSGWEGNLKRQENKRKEGGGIIVKKNKKKPSSLALGAFPSTLRKCALLSRRDPPFLRIVFSHPAVPGRVLVHLKSWNPRKPFFKGKIIADLRNSQGRWLRKRGTENTQKTARASCCLWLLSSVEVKELREI